MNPISTPVESTCQLEWVALCHESGDDQEMSFGEKLKRLRKAAGISITELSERSGVAIGTISALEVRHSEWSKYAPSLAQALGVPIEALAVAGKGLPAAGKGVISTPQNQQQRGRLTMREVLAELEGYLLDADADARAAAAMLLKAWAEDPVTKANNVGAIERLLQVGTARDRAPSPPRLLLDLAAKDNKH